MLFFGLNPRKKMLNKFFSGIVLTIFTAFLVHIPFTSFSSLNSVLIVLRVMTITRVIATLSSYLLMKKRSEKVMKIFLKLKNHQKVNFIADESEKLRSLLPIGVILILTFSAMSLTFTNKNVGKSYEIKTFPIDFEKLFALSVLYLTGWTVILQTIYFELFFRYYTIIEDFNNRLKRRIAEPSPMTVINVQKSVNTFIRFQIDLSENVNILIYFIISIIIALNGIFITIVFLSPEFSLRFYLFNIIFLFSLNAHFLWTQKTLLEKRKSISELIKRLNKWQYFKKKLELSVELAVLELSLSFMGKD